MRTIGLEQSPAYFSRIACSASKTPSRVSSCQRTQSLSQPRSIISVDSYGFRERSRERSTSPFEGETLRVPPRRRDSGSASNDRSRSRSLSPPRRKYPDSIWKKQMICDIVSYISNLHTPFDFAIGCGIPSCIVWRIIEDNYPSYDNISLEDCVDCLVA